MNGIIVVININGTDIIFEDMAKFSYPSLPSTKINERLLRGFVLRKLCVNSWPESSWTDLKRSSWLKKKHVITHFTFTKITILMLTWSSERYNDFLKTVQITASPHAIDRRKTWEKNWTKKELILTWRCQWSFISKVRSFILWKKFRK